MSDRPLTPMEKKMLALMAVIKIAYPNFNAPAREAAILWAEMFSGTDPQTVEMAVKAYITADTKGFPPSIGQIKEKVHLMEQPEILSEVAAWALVKKAIRNSGYHATAEYNKLPPTIQKVVTPELLKDWAMSTPKEEQVIASNFMRSYRAQADRETEIAALPEDIKAALEHKQNALPQQDNVIAFSSIVTKALP